MSARQRLVMMAGLARDPAEADTIYNDLARRHGDQVNDFIYLELHRRRAHTLRERAWMLIRQILGEEEPRRFEARRKPSVAKVVSKVRLPHDL